MATGTIFDRDTLLHLRIPFSFYLLPIFCFGVSQAAVIHLYPLLVVFVAIHLFIYPASNGYNSYMDQDKGSIGGLKTPPPATRKLYYASILFDGVGLSLCLLAGWPYVALAAGYIASSKAYSWHGIRLKKYAFGGWAVVTLFQGGYTFILASMAAQPMWHGWFTEKNIIGMLFSSLIVGGSYPLTQIYQHEEDSERGDLTISYRLGVRGTFLFTAVVFTLATALAYYYFTKYYNIFHFFVFAGFAIPPLVYLNWWFMQVLKDPAQADFDHAMRMNKISSVCMVCCFALLILNHVQQTPWF